MRVYILNARQTNMKLRNYEFGVVIDLREPEYYMEGHLPGAINIPTTEINYNLDYIRSITNDEILLYCESGNQSVTVGKVLLLSGFNNVYSLAKGINGYKYELCR